MHAILQQTVKITTNSLYYVTDSTCCMMHKNKASISLTLQLTLYIDILSAKFANEIDAGYSYVLVCNIEAILKPTVFIFLWLHCVSFAFT